MRISSTKLLVYQARSGETKLQPTLELDNTKTGSDTALQPTESIIYKLGGRKKIYAGQANENITKKGDSYPNWVI